MTGSGELVGGDSGSWPSECRTGELWGRGGSSGRGGWSDLTGGLCDLMGVARMTLAPPPSNGPGTSCWIAGSTDVDGSVLPLPGVESGLGAHSDILGETGLTRSGEEVLVSATDSPRSGQTSHYLKSYTSMLHLLIEILFFSNKNDC